MSQPPLNPPPAGCCATCSSWIHTPGSARSQMELGRTPVGECHAGPPSGNFTWPRTQANHWCGAYRMKAEPKPKPSTPAKTTTAPLSL